jgi:hypothetical protein
MASLEARAMRRPPRIVRPTVRACEEVEIPTMWHRTHAQSAGIGHCSPIRGYGGNGDAHTETRRLGGRTEKIDLVSRSRGVVTAACGRRWGGRGTPTPPDRASRGATPLQDACIHRNAPARYWPGQDRHLSAVTRSCRPGLKKSLTIRASPWRLRGVSVSSVSPGESVASEPSVRQNEILLPPILL